MVFARLVFVLGGLTMLGQGSTLSHATFPYRTITPIPTGPEFSVADPLIGPSAFRAEGAIVGAGPAGFLAVWHDGRSWSRATILSNDANPLDRFGFSLPPGAPLHRLIFWNGESYVVVANVHSSTAIIRISEEGKPLDESWQPVAAVSLDACWSGSRLLIISRGPEGEQIEITDGHGRPLGEPRPFRPPGRLLAIGSNGSSFLAIWDLFNFEQSAFPRGIYATRISEDGEIDGTPSLILQAPEFRATVASNSRDYLVLMDSGTLLGVAADGTPIAPGTRIPGASIGFHTAAVWTGSSYVVLVFRSSSPGQLDLVTYSVDSRGALLDTTPALVTGRIVGIADAAIAWNGASAVAVWASPHPQAATLDAGGRRIDAFPGEPGIPVTLSAPAVSRPSGAFARDVYLAEVYLALWSEWSKVDGPSAAFGARVTSNGIRIDEHGFAIDAATTNPIYANPPRAVWNGESFLVIWETRRGSSFSLVGKRVGLDGVILDPDPLVIVPTLRSGNWDLATDGTTVLVVWSTLEEESVIRGARVTRDGTVLDPDGFQISYSPTIVSDEWRKTQMSPSVDYGPGEYAVVWHELFHIPCWGLCPRPKRSNILATRVWRDGILLDSTKVLADPGIDHTYFWAPRITWNGSTYGVVWSVASAAPSWSEQSAIFATCTQDLAQTSKAEVDVRDPTVASLGSDLVVAGDSATGVTLYRFDPSGQLVGPPARLPEGTYAPELVQSREALLLLYLRRERAFGDSPWVFGRLLEVEHRRRAVTR